MNTSTSDQSNQYAHIRVSRSRRRTAIVFVGLALTATLLGACSSSSPKAGSVSVPVEADTASTPSDTAPTNSAANSAPPDTTAVTPDNSASVPTDNAATTNASTANATASSGAVLPVPNNPITNTATAQTLKVDSALVENNLDATGKAASDHLEIALSNTGTTDATEIEIFYSFVDPTAAATENYYTKLPADFTVPAGGKRIVHFDDTGAPDHFPVNKFSLYYTSTNAMDVSVIASAKGAALQKFDLKKDAGGEAAD